MMIDNNIKVRKTIEYLRELADNLENNNVYLNQTTIESRNICYNVEEETLTIQILKAVNNG